MIAWIKGYARGMTLLVLLAAVAAVATGFSGSPQGSGQSFTPPTDVQATSSGETVTVTWTPGSGASSQVIVVVNVLDDTDYCLGFDATGGASSHECPGLSSGATYVVLLIALDGAGGYRLGKDAQGNLVTHTLLSVPVSQEVGAGEAATVTHDSGAQLEVPAGALPEATTVSIAEVQPPASDIPVGRVYDFSVGEVELAQPVTLRVPYQLGQGQTSELLYAVHWNEDAGEWERVEAEVDEATGSVVVSTTNLSRFSYALVSVDATCSVEPDADDVGSYKITASITSRTLFDITIYMAPEVRETTRNATFFDQSDVRSFSRTLSRNETRSLSESFSLRYMGDYKARCRIFWELRGPGGLLGTDVELKPPGQEFILLEVAENASPDPKGSKLNECSMRYVDPVSGKLMADRGQGRTVLAGESLGIVANGFAFGEDKIFTPLNTPHLVAAIAGYHRGELLDKSIGRKKAVYKGYSTIPLATTNFDFPQVGEYTIDCMLWWFLDDPKIPDFRNATQESIKDLLRCIRDGAACLGYLNALRDVRTVTVNAVPALWSPRPMAIEPAGGLPHDSPDSQITVRAYTRESTTTGHTVTPPTIVLRLTDNLGLSALSRWIREPAEACGTVGSEHCWEATFDMPLNPARAVLHDDGTLTANHLVYSVGFSTDRTIRGAVPSGGVVVKSRPPLSTDLQVLDVIYDATSGTGWTNRSGWTSSTADADQRHGVDVDGDNRVSRLELDNNNLRGDLPPALGLLTSLQHLDLSGNRLSREIPATLGTLSSLTHLDLSNNDLGSEIPISLGGLTNLESLILSDNDLEGELPAWLGQLSNLQTLDLADNDLSGTVPNGLGALANLENVYLSGNDLSGCIPVGVRNLRNDDFDDLELPFCDVALTGLSVSPWELEPAFEPHRLRYSATVYDTQVTISPVNDHGATFEYRKNGRLVAETDAATPGFQVELAECGDTTVEITVVSADGKDEETYSITFSGESGGVPGAPVIRSVTEGSGSLTVAWNAPETECPGDLDHYNLRYSLDQDEPDWTDVRGPSNGLSHRITGLTSGETYLVQVQAVTEFGAGPWSESATGTPTTSRPQRPTTTTPSRHYTVNEGDGAVNIRITISERPNGIAEAQFSTFDGTASLRNDYSYVRIRIRFNPSDPNLSLTQTIPIPIIDDFLVEDTESFVIRVEPTNFPFLPGWDSRGEYITVQIRDNDSADFGFIDPQDSVNEGEAASICVMESPGSRVALAISISMTLSHNDPGGVLASGSSIPSSLLFLPGDRTRCFTAQTNNVSQDTDVIFTLTSSDSRVNIVEPTMTLTVLNTNP